jgi:hypothetical protein
MTSRALDIEIEKTIRVLNMVSGNTESQLTAEDHAALEWHIGKYEEAIVAFDKLVAIRNRLDDRIEELETKLNQRGK